MSSNLINRSYKAEVTEGMTRKALLMAFLCPKGQKGSVRITAVKAMDRTDLASHSLCIQGLLVLSFLFPILNHPSGSTRATYYFTDILFYLLLVEQFCIQITYCAVSKVHKLAPCISNSICVRTSGLTLLMQC